MGQWGNKKISPTIENEKQHIKTYGVQQKQFGKFIAINTTSSSERHKKTLTTQCTRKKNKLCPELAQRRK